jgi:hypothetical protein
MSTTDDDTTTDAPTPDHEELPDAVDADRVALDRERYGEYRSLQRLSPTNEAASCETVAEVRAAITRENYREEPREWVVALLNERAAEVADAE